MITGLHIRNFKCFDSFHFSLSPLTLLTGFNAAGKSTTLQSLLLLCQTIRKSERNADLWLDGELVQLGSPGDVLNQAETSTEGLELGVETGGLTASWTFKVLEREEERVLRLSSVRIVDAHHRVETYDAGDSFTKLLPRSSSADMLGLANEIRELIFVGAVRKPENELFPVPSDPEPVCGNVGSCGEFAPWWFHRYDDEPVPSERCFSFGDAPRTLRGQVNAWLGELFPGAEVNCQPLPRTRLVRLEFKTGRTSAWHRPSNTGYGLSYAFPILVAGLCAKENQLLIVDSPEAHLHPRGQSRMGTFLSKVAKSGVRVIIETHSDHIVNGVRIAIRDQVLPAVDCGIFFFSPASEGKEGKARPNVVSISADSKGNLSHWPEGFFDQAESDLSKLAGWSQ